MTVLQVAQLASSVIGITRPTILFAATDDTSVQVQDCINETAQMVAFDAGHDWTKLKALATITGDGSATTFSLPTDYARMLLKSSLWPSAMPNVPLMHVPDTDTWLGLVVQNFTTITPRWTIIGTQINILPAVAAAATVKYYYLRNTIITDAAAAVKTAFTADTDTFPLGERLLRLAFIYRWKQDRGQDYGEAMEDYQTALATHIGHDKGSNILVSGRQRAPQVRAGLAFPGTLGV